MKRWFFILALLSLGSRAQAVASTNDWRSLFDEGRALGIDATRLQSVVVNCRQHEIEAVTGAQLLQPVYDIAREQLDANLVLVKLEEVLTKNVEHEAIIAAVKKRAESIQRAHTILHGARGQHVRCHDELIAAIVHALESGLPATLLQNVLQQCTNWGLMQQTTLMESGEMLLLAGFTIDAVQTLLTDFVTHKLRTNQMLCSVRSAIQAKKEAKDFAEIRRYLWGTD